MKLSIKSLLAALVVSLSLAAPAWAGPYEDADSAYSRGDYATASRLVRPLVEQGNRDAQHNLGVMFLMGQGVKQDYAKALAWYRKAAEQGHTDAQYNLGAIYYECPGVPQDYTEAAKWWSKAAEQGHAEAQNNLGQMYCEGKGVPQDEEEALDWFRKAAKQSNIKGNRPQGHGRGGGDLCLYQRSGCGRNPGCGINSTPGTEPETIHSLNQK